MTMDHQFINASEVVNGVGRMGVLYTLTVPPFTNYVWTGSAFAALPRSEAGGLVVDGTPWPNAHPAYLFHGCAPGSAADDGRFRDLSGANDGVFGTHLSRAQAWANLSSGYISTVDPVAGAQESVIRIPPPSFDYAGGEKLLVLWGGQVTPEGSSVPMMGTSSAAADKGVALYVRTDARLDWRAYNGTDTINGPQTTNDAAGQPFVAGEYHSYAALLDGQTRTASYVVDGVVNREAVQMGSGQSIDTLSAATWAVGKATPLTTGTSGIATKTRYLAILKWGPTQPAPTAAQIAAVSRQLDASPQSLILAGAL
jgi:hypothetical protein